MTHPERDQDLLLLAHGALPPLKAALTRLHLICCLDCRRRRGHLQATSQALVVAIRGPQLSRGEFPTAGGSLGVATAWLLALTVLVVILLGTVVVRRYQRILERRSAPAISIPCPLHTLPPRPPQRPLPPISRAQASSVGREEPIEGHG